MRIARRRGTLRWVGELRHPCLKMDERDFVNMQNGLDLRGGAVFVEAEVLLAMRSLLLDVEEALRKVRALLAAAEAKAQGEEEDGEGETVSDGEGLEKEKGKEEVEGRRRSKSI